MSSAPPLRVLFLCTGNSARSQIAEALLRHKAGSRFTVASAEDQTWDIIITTCDKGRESCPSFPGQPVYAHWSVPDPAIAAPGDRDEAFSDAVRLLSWRIDLMLTVRLDSIGRHGVEETVRRVGTESPDSQSSPASN